MKPLRWTHAERLSQLIADLRARGHFVTTADKLIADIRARHQARPCPDPEPSAEPAVAIPAAPRPYRSHFERLGPTCCWMTCVRRPSPVEPSAEPATALPYGPEDLGDLGPLGDR